MRKWNLTLMNSGEIGAIAKDDALLLLPVGCVEQHGPVGFTGADTYLAEYVCHRAAERLEGVYVAPPLWFGYTPYTSFAGTVSLRLHTLEAVVQDVIEGYLAHGRLSAFAGLGYTPRIDDFDPEGVTVAAGVRGYTAGLKHRAFAEASVCQVGTLSDPSEPKRFYGPCGQLGYQFASRGGFTFLLSLGAGYALGAGGYRNRTLGLVGVGVGYTWRRKDLAEDS